MKHKFLYLWMLFASCLWTGCSSGSDMLPEVPDEPESPEVSGQEGGQKAVEVVRMNAEDIKSGNSRTAFTLESDKLKFGWAEGDVVGVYPTESDQTSFTIKSGVGTNSARFDGGAWALRNGETYAAYYPYDLDNSNRSNAEIRFSYEGQAQVGNGSLAHLGSHDFMATQPTIAANDELNFDFKHLNSVVQLRLTLPVAVEFSEMALRSNGDIFAKVGNLDLSGESYGYTAHEMTNELSMTLTDIATTDNENGKLLVLYMMLFPVDLSAETVSVILKSTDSKVYQGELPKKKLEAGYAYSLSATLADVTFTSENVDSPDFEMGNIGG